MTLYPHTWLARFTQNDDQAERFHRALLLPETMCSDGEIAGLVATTQLLRPGVAMSEAARKRGLDMMLAAATGEDAGVPDAGSHDDRAAPVDLGTLTTVVDAAGELGMLKLADVERITPERAQRAAEEVAALMAAAKARAATT